MKKILTSAIALILAGTLSAQDLKSKKGETILPEEGDYALGFDADPFLDYVGNFLNQAGNSAPGADFTRNSNLSIVGKMFKDAQTAYRGRVRLGFGNTSNRNFVSDDANTTDPNAMVEDERTTSYTQITLGAGLEKRRGTTRIQGFYGGEALIGFGTRSTSQSFGNAFTATNMMPTSTDFDANSIGQVSSRTTETSTGSTLNFQLRGFAGVEIFVFPKVSLAMEFGWGPQFSTTGDGESTMQSWDATNSVVQTQTMPVAGGSSFTIDTDNASGALTILFHF